MSYKQTSNKMYDLSSNVARSWQRNDVLRTRERDHEGLSSFFFVIPLEWRFKIFVGASRGYWLCFHLVSLSNFMLEIVDMGRWT